MKVNTKMDPKAGGHRWDFVGSPCIVCGMSASRFSDTKAPCPGPKSEGERILLPDEDAE
jgi:hypothetical protein